MKQWKYVVLCLLFVLTVTAFSGCGKTDADIDMDEDLTVEDTADNTADNTPDGMPEVEIPEDDGGDILLPGGSDVTTEPEVVEPEVTEPEVVEPETTEPEVVEPEVTEPETTEPETTEKRLDLAGSMADIEMRRQLEFISNNRDLWRVPEMDGVGVYYMVADMDHNSRLELISATMQGTGQYTYSTIWEMNDPGTALELCDKSTVDGYSESDILIDSTVVGIDGETYHYFFTDVVRNGYAESYYSSNIVTLIDGLWQETSLGMEVVLTDLDGNATVTYRGGDGNEISGEVFVDILNDYFKDMEVMYENFAWFAVDNNDDWTQVDSWYDDPISSALEQSWLNFTLRTE